MYVHFEESEFSERHSNLLISSFIEKIASPEVSESQ